MAPSFFRVLYRFGLFVTLVALFSGAGCSQLTFLKKPAHEPTWTCDDAADRAIKERDYETAIVLHHQLLEREPLNGLAHYHLGYAYGQIGDHEKEVQYYEKAISLGLKSESAFINLGMAYGDLDRIDDALRAFHDVLEINPNSADGHFGLGLCYQRMVADDMAEREFLKTLAIDSNHADARLHLSMLYADRGELQKAGEQLKKILETDPTNERAREFLRSIERE
jgi:tetratricopeptide (TPR) repeat protein